jgi:hypothetical protein
VEQLQALAQMLLDMGAQAGHMLLSLGSKSSAEIGGIADWVPSRTAFPSAFIGRGAWGGTAADDRGLLAAE